MFDELNVYHESSFSFDQHSQKKKNIPISRHFYKYRKLIFILYFIWYLVDNQP